jgi:uncharacterized protein YbbC (DUF1343 family)
MKTGLMRLLEDPRRFLRSARVGLIANPTTIDGALQHAAPLLAAHPDVQLVKLFGPEHGIYGVAQDMIDVDDARDPWTGLPVRSLYGHTEASLSPKAGDLEDLDLLVFDIQDIGSRYYTYAATMALCMRAAGRAGLEIVVLDRPNPLNGVQMEGGGITKELASFVGLYPVPQRHAMTVGELARLYNTHFGIECELEVVTCDGWTRTAYFDELRLPWVMPSPNMPTLGTAIVYPGMCLLEGTNLSEGRGTTRPFEFFGAPFIDGRALATELAKLELPGARFRPCFFRPTFHKFAGRTCGGLELHVTDRREFLSYRTGLAVLAAVRRLWPNDLEWRTDTYEFRHDVPAIDLLTGLAGVREAIDRGAPFAEIYALAISGAESFPAARAQALLY